MSRLCSEEALVLEGGGLRAIMVLLLKQMHLQKDVAVDFALWEGAMMDSRTRKRTEKLINGFMVKDRGERKPRSASKEGRDVAGGLELRLDIALQDSRARA